MRLVDAVERLNSPPMKTGVVLYEVREPTDHGYCSVGADTTPQTEFHAQLTDTKTIVLLTTNSDDLEPSDPHFSAKNHSTFCHIGALRPGGPVALWSKDYIGLLLDWFLVGLFNVTLTTLLITILQSFLGFTDFQANAAYCLDRLPWQFKFVTGFVTDCYPIQRRRRKPYILIGWSLFAIFMVAIASVSLPKPHVRGQDEIPDTRGRSIVVVMILAQLAHVLTVSALEGFMVECAQREGQLVRGRTQCLCLMFRFTGELVGNLSLSLAFNSAEFGGTFAASVSIRVVFLFVGLLAIGGVVLTWFCLREDKTIKTTQRLTTQIRLLWGMMQQQATWQVTVMGFVLILGTMYNVQEEGSIVGEWLGATRLEYSISNTMGDLGYAIAAASYMTLWCNANWRKTMTTCLLLSLVISIPVDMVVVFDIWRNRILYFVKYHITNLFHAMLLVLRAVMIIEVVQPGYEAVGYGLISTVYNLGLTVITITQNVLATGFAPSVTDLSKDTMAVRRHIANELIAKYILMVLAILAMYILMPRQKPHLQEIRQRSHQNMLVPVLLFVVFSIFFLLSLTSTLLAMNESTACLPFAGGSGC